MVNIFITDFPRQLGILGVLFLFSFWYLFAFLTSIISVRLNKAAIRKRKASQGRKEWLFFSRFKDVIPEFWRVFYIIVCAVHLIGILISILIYAFNAPVKISAITVRFILYFDLIWAILHRIIFFNSKFSNSGIRKWFGKRKK